MRFGDWESLLTCKHPGSFATLRGFTPRIASRSDTSMHIMIGADRGGRTACLGRGAGAEQRRCKDNGQTAEEVIHAHEWFSMNDAVYPAESISVYCSHSIFKK